MNSSRFLTIRTCSGLNLLAALWLFISASYLDSHLAPWLFRNNIIIGIFIFILAGVQLAWPGRAFFVSWITAAFGFCLAAAPFIFQAIAPSGLIWNNVIVGALVALLGVVSASTSWPERALRS